MLLANFQWYCFDVQKNDNIVILGGIKIDSTIHIELQQVGIIFHKISLNFRNLSRLC